MLKLIPGFGDLMSNRGQEKVESINVRDEIDEEAAKPLEDYGAQIRSDTRANGAEFANYCAPATHYDDLKDYPEYDKVVTTLAGARHDLDARLSTPSRNRKVRPQHGNFRAPERR